MERLAGKMSGFRYREPINQWLATSGKVDLIVERLCAYTPLDTAKLKQELVDTTKESLIKKIGECVQSDRFVQMN